MLPIKHLFLLACIWLLGSIGNTCLAQGQNNYWVFGNHMGMDFNQSPPALVTTSAVTYEGSAAICDKWGNLKFYCDADTVWDANHNMMPNGDSILGNGDDIGFPGSCTQGVTIVPSMADTNQYYIFTLDAFENYNIFDIPGYYGHLRYTLVDMSLNGGLGEVIPTQKNIIIDTFTSEQATVVPAGFCGYWLIIHRNNSNQYRAYRIDEDGLNTTPVISHGIWEGDMSLGTMKASPDGKRIVLATNSINKIETALFDNVNGTLNNFQQFDEPSNRYGLSFSPDGSKIYISNYFNVSQFDISLLPDIAAVEGSKYTYPSIMSPYGALRTGPDGRVYVVHYLTPYIGTINNPNASGTDADFDPYTYLLPASAMFGQDLYGLGLGNDNAILIDDTITNRVVDTVLCFEDSWLAQASPGYQAYIWNDGSTEVTKNITQSGTYWVYIPRDCAVLVDSFYVLFSNYAPDLGPDSFICINGSVTLDPLAPSGTSFLWQDGSTESSYEADTSGIYFVETTVNGCVASDTIALTIINPSMRILTEDTSICVGIPFTLTAVSVPDGNFVWDDGTTGPELNIDQAGTYSVTVVNVCGTFSDEVTITDLVCNCHAMIPSAFTPNGDGHNDVFLPLLSCQAAEYVLQVFNRWGQQVFESNNPANGWDGRYNGQLAETATYFYYLEFKDEEGKVQKRKGDLTVIK